MWYQEPIRWLVIALLVLVIIFLTASAFELREFASPVFFSIAILILVILILARFGGPFEPAD